MSFSSQAAQNTKFDKTPTDTISCIAFNNNPNAQLVCCSSWDNTITIWQVLNAMGNNIPNQRHLITVKGPSPDAMLCCTFKDNDIIVGTASGKIGLLAYGKSDISTVGSHAGIVSGVHWTSQNLLCSGSSYDYKLNFWDLRESTKPANSIDLPGKCKCLDASNDKIVIVTSDDKILQYDMKLGKISKTFSTKIKCPITSIAITPDGLGYVAGGQYGIIEANISGSGADLIECHRDTQGKETYVYASNCVAISNISPKNVIISGGGDGCMAYINAENLATNTTKKLTSRGDPVTACAIMPKTKIYVVATGNDWSRGADAAKGAPQPEMTMRMFNAKEITS